MDSGSSSLSRTRSGLVRKKGIFALNKASCSRTRSGLLRVKSFMLSRDASRTRSGLVRIKSFKDSSDSSCSRTQSDPVRGSPHVVEVCSPHVVEDLMDDEAVLNGSPDELVTEDSPVRTQNGLVRGSPAYKAVAMDEPVTKRFPDGCSNDEMPSRTRSGLVRIKSFKDSSDSSCFRTQSDPVRGSHHVVEDPMDDEAVLNGSPDELVTEDSPVRTQNGLVRGSPAYKAVAMDEPVTKRFPDGCSNDEMPSRTRSGLVRKNPTVKTLRKDGPVINVFPDGCHGEDMPDGTRSGLVTGSPAIKIQGKDQPVIKGLADGWLKEDMPLGTRSGLVRGSLAAKAPVRAKLVTKGQPNGWTTKEKAAETQPAAKTQSNNERVIEGLPDGWRKEYRPRKSGSFQDTFYIDPDSGYEFRSLKDVHRYLETGDINQCIIRPKKSNTSYDVHITESQPHTITSSQHTRPSTADKGIQCEILTSEGIMVPWEELVTPYSGNYTEHTVLPESEKLKVMQGNGDKIETLEHTNVQQVSAQRGPRQTKSLKRKAQNRELRSEKHKTSPVVTPVRVSPRLAALNVQQEVHVEPEDEPIILNPVNLVRTMEENSNDQSQMGQSGTLNQVHGNLESTSNQLQLSQTATGKGMEAIQENTTNHSQPSQAETVDHTQTNQEKTANQVESILADIPVLDDRSITNHADIPIQTMRECTTDPLTQADILNHIQTDQVYTASRLQSSQAGTVRPFQEYIDYLQPGKADTINQMQANQETTCNQFHLSQVDTLTEMQIIQENMTRQSHMSQADTVSPIHIDLENTIGYSQPSKADTINQLQANQENTADQLHFSQADCVTQIEMIQGNICKDQQLSQADSVDQIHINLEDTTNHLQPNYDENSMLQAGFWAPEQNGGASITDFWENVENVASSVPMPMDGSTVASFPANVRFQSSAGAEEPALPAQSAAPETCSDQSGLAFQSLFGNAWSDPCIEFAFKTLTGDIPVLDDTTAVTDYFPEQQDLNKDPSPNCSASVLDNTRNHTQVDVNLPAPMPSDKLYNGSWFPPQ